MMKNWLNHLNSWWKWKFVENENGLLLFCLHQVHLVWSCKIRCENLYNVTPYFLILLLQKMKGISVSFSRLLLLRLQICDADRVTSSVLLTYINGFYVAKRNILWFQKLMFDCKLESKTDDSYQVKWFTIRFKHYKYK